MGNPIDISTLQNFPADSIFIELLQHTNILIENMQKTLLEKMESMKRSILYDFEKKVADLKANIILSPMAAVVEEDNMRKKLAATLPIQIIEEFLEFDKQLKENEEKRKALKILFRTTTGGTICIRSDISKMMGTLIGKQVQLKYSGSGRKTKNYEGKLNFSSTTCFHVMQEFLTEKFSQSSENLHIKTHLSRWLSGANDRDGGRRARKDGTGNENEQEIQND